MKILETWLYSVAYIFLNGIFLSNIFALLRIPKVTHTFLSNILEILFYQIPIMYL